MEKKVLFGKKFDENIEAEIALVGNQIEISVKADLKPAVETVKAKITEKVGDGVIGKIVSGFADMIGEYAGIDMDGSEQMKLAPKAAREEVKEEEPAAPTQIEGMPRGVVFAIPEEEQK